jgi:argininosuccinate synthase
LRTTWPIVPPNRYGEADGKKNRKNRARLFGRLDTSIILKWLQEAYECEVVTFTADLGQGEELEPARAKAAMFGVKDVRIVDLREEFVRDFIFPMLRANTLYEGQYLLGSSIARPLIAKHLVAIAKEIGADAVAHGATGKGNDQVRFELAVNALDPSIKIIAPWRQWNIRSRTQLLEYAEKHRIPVPSDKRGEAPFSIDANLLHTSTEGKILENPSGGRARSYLSAHDRSCRRCRCP